MAVIIVVIRRAALERFHVQCAVCVCTNVADGKRFSKYINCIRCDSFDNEIFIEEGLFN